MFFLNGLPIVALEVKHEANQNVHDAVAQFAARDHACRIFRHPFLYLAADTSDVKAATDPRREENFRWHNMGLKNVPLPEQDRPREKLSAKGAKVLSDQELPAVMLGKGTPGLDVMTLAGKLAKVVDQKGLELKVEDLTALKSMPVKSLPTPLPTVRQASSSRITTRQAL